MSVSTHHRKTDALSEQDRRNAAAYQLWLSRMAAHYRPADLATAQQREQLVTLYADKFAECSDFLEHRAARIREEIRQAARRGLRIVNGGRR